MTVGFYRYAARWGDVTYWSDSYHDVQNATIEDVEKDIRLILASRHPEFAGAKPEDIDMIIQKIE